jgi:hypothetical protein
MTNDRGWEERRKVPSEAGCVSSLVLYVPGYTVIDFIVPRRYYPGHYLLTRL